MAVVAKVVPDNMQITNTYLMWIGSAHYGSIDEWIEEAYERGVSKRLPTAAIGKTLLLPGTVVFVAHDEGVMFECPQCFGEIECPCCRISVEKAKKEHGHIESLELEATHTKHLPTVKEVQKKVVKAKERMSSYLDAIDECEVCFGASGQGGVVAASLSTLGEVETIKMHKCVKAGTGGQVVFGDEDAWDYKKYIYYRNQPKKWNAEQKGGIEYDNRCKQCGGSGRIPNGKVFGFFVPDAIEYIEKGDTEDTKKMIEGGFKAVTDVTKEALRRCGKRHKGGVYAVTFIDSKCDTMLDVVEGLGVDEGAVEVKGSFAKFISPLDISGTKRFRGIARWAIPEETEDGIEMIADALL